MDKSLGNYHESMVTSPQLSPQLSPANWQLFRGRVVTANQVIDDGALVVDDTGHLAYVGTSAALSNGAHPAATAALQGIRLPSLPDSTPAGTEFLLPGLIDVHCHGGAGVSFPDCHTLAEVERSAREHLMHGTTTLVASLVTATLTELEAQAELLAQAVGNNLIQAFHFEGPFISAARCGAQNPHKIQELNPQNAQRLVRAARGQAFSMTIAPEQVASAAGRAGLKILVEAGITPSWGHTCASLEQTRQAVALGAELAAELAEASGAASETGPLATVTHLFNGMNPMHHRNPGAIPEFLAQAARGNLLVELIGDGVHVDPQLVVAMVDLLGRDAVMLVTDAMAAAGMADGEYVLGGQRVLVQDGAAYLAKDQCLAGGTSHLVEQVQVAVQAGISLVDACYLASATPARALRLTDRGRLEAGLRADFIATDSHLRPIGVWREGKAIGISTR